MLEYDRMELALPLGYPPYPYRYTGYIYSNIIFLFFSTILFSFPYCYLVTLTVYYFTSFPSTSSTTVTILPLTYSYIISYSSRDLLSSRYLRTRLRVSLISIPILTFLLMFSFLIVIFITKGIYLYNNSRYLRTRLRLYLLQKVMGPARA